MAGYRITNLPEGTLVTYWPDPRGPGHGKCEAGYVEAMAAQTCRIVWAGYMKKGKIKEGDITGTEEMFRASELKYLEDRGLMRFKRPPKQRRIRLPDNLIHCKTCGVTRDIGCDCPRPGALKPEFWGQKSVTKVLTSAERDDSMTSSIDTGEGNPTQKGAIQMAKTKSKKTKDIEPDDDFVELDEVEEDDDEPADDPTEGKLSAKEAAKAIGTDARTLRKFLRKKAGKVGQGNRWLIDPDDLKKLKAEFEASSRPKADADEDDDEDNEPKPKAKKSKSKTKTKPAPRKSDEEIYGSDDEDEDEDPDEDDDEFEVFDEIDDL